MIQVMTGQDGNFTDNVTLTDGTLTLDEAVKFDSKREVFFAQKNGTVDRWNGDTGIYEGSLTLKGYGDDGDGESESPKDRGIAYAYGCGDFYITYNGANEHLSFWSAEEGVRLYRYKLNGAGGSVSTVFSLSYVNGYALLYNPDSVVTSFALPALTLVPVETLTSRRGRERTSTTTASVTLNLCPTLPLIMEKESLCIFAQRSSVNGRI
jgi:hypothetical protein